MDTAGYAKKLTPSSIPTFEYNNNDNEDQRKGRCSWQYTSEQGGCKVIGWRESYKEKHHPHMTVYLCALGISLTSVLYVYRLHHKTENNNEITELLFVYR